MDIVDYSSPLGCSQYLIPKLFEDDEINRLSWVSNTCVNYIRAVTKLICPRYNFMQIWDILRWWAARTALQSKDEKHFLTTRVSRPLWLGGWVHCQRRPNCHSIEITPLPPPPPSLLCCAKQAANISLQLTASVYIKPPLLLLAIDYSRERNMLKHC